MANCVVKKIYDYARIKPLKIALSNGKTSLTYIDLCKQIEFAKSKLQSECKLKKGDYLILAAKKEISFVSLYFACHLLQVTVIPIDAECNPSRLCYIVKSTGCSKSVGLPCSFGDVINYSFSEFEGVCEDFSFENISFPKLSDVADLVFTTGTTGEPKGVILTQKNIAASSANINQYIKNIEDDIELLALPISHSFGLGRMRCALSNGQTLILLGSFANIKRFFRYIEQFNVTGFGLVPSSFSLIKKLSGNKLFEYANQIKYIELGSAPMCLDDKLELKEKMPNTRICMHYGLTEASRSTFLEFHEDKKNLLSIGKASPNTSIKIFNSEGFEVPFGQKGEICILSDAVCSGYLNNEKANNELFFGSYLRTGDLGQYTSSKYINLCSRIKELINVGGKKVSPTEVENALKSINGVDDCACIGIKDNMLGEVVKAYIVSKDHHQLNKEFLTQSLSLKLESYKIPFEYEFIEEIPKTSSGKIQRNMLKTGK